MRNVERLATGAARVDDVGVRGQRAQPETEPVARVRRRAFEATLERAAANDDLLFPHSARSDQPTELQPLPGGDKCAGRQRLRPVEQLAPAPDLQTDRVEDAFVKIGLRRGAAPVEFALQHGPEDLQRDPAVGELRPRLRLDRRLERLREGGNGAAESAEADPARQLQEMPQRGARFSRIALPLRDRAHDELVQIEQAVVLRRDGERTPKALRSAVQRMRFGAIVPGGVLLENRLTFVRDDERMQAVFLSVRRRGIEIHGVTSGSRAIRAAMPSRTRPPARSIQSDARSAAELRRKRSAASE